MRDSFVLRNRLAAFLKNNSSQKKVIIINSYEKIETIAKVVKSCLGCFGPKTTILCFKSGIPDAFNDFADRVTISEDYLTDQDCLKIDDYVFNNISKNWDKEAKERFRGIFFYHNVELGRLAEYNLGLFLVPRVKALVVLDRAIKNEHYQAAFIIDTNKELERFDRLLPRIHGIAVDMVSINEKEAAIIILRRRFTALICGLLDRLAFRLIEKKQQARLIDARLYYQLNRVDAEGFILAPFEQGLKLRLRCLLHNRGYIVLDLGRKRSKRPIDRAKDFGNFNLQALAQQFIFENINYWELVEDQLRRVIWHDFSRNRRNIDYLANAHKIHGLKAVILRNDVREFEKMVVSWAKTIVLPSIVIQHGILAEPNGHNIVFADKVVVWGRSATRWYEKFGNDPAKMIVVGNPNFDNLFHDMNLAKDRNFINKLKLTEGRCLVTLITSGIDMWKISSFVNDDETSILIKAVVKAVKSVGNINLVIKLHPNDKTGVFKKLIDREDRNFVHIIEKTNLSNLIKASDLIITKGSTAALEAILIKKPIVVVSLDRSPAAVPYVERNVAIGAYKTGDIEPVIRRALYNPDVRAEMELARGGFIDDFLYKFDGKATERIMQLIGNP